jgi:predicted nucleic acid-binding protein
LRYLLDTNIVIAALRPATPENAQLKQALQTDEVVISAVTLSEFLVGATEHDADMLNRLLRVVQVYSIDEQIARQAAEIRADAAKEKRIFLLDCFVAATAQVNDCALVTRDADFSTIQDLTIETWG